MTKVGLYAIDTSTSLESEQEPATKPRMALRCASHHPDYAPRRFQKTFWGQRCSR